MVNYYSIWTNVVILFVFIFGIIYLVPSLYGEDPAIYITKTVSSYYNIDDSVLKNVVKILKNEKVSVKSNFLYSNKIVIRFFTKEDQLNAYKKLCNIFLSKDFIISIGTASAAPNWLTMIFAKPIKFGLDLQGGMYFLIRVDINTILHKLQEQYMDIYRINLQKNMIPYMEIYKFGECNFEIQFQDKEHLNQAILCLSKIHHGLLLRVFMNKKLQVMFSDSYMSSIYDNIMKKNADILRYRVHQLGIIEPSIQRYGNNHILVELPGIQDIIKIKEILSSTVNLEFRLVNTEIKKIELDNNLLPKDSEFKLNNEGHLIPLYKQAILTGDYIIDSNVSCDEYGRPQVHITLDSTGSAIMSKFTKNNIGKIIAILFIEYKNKDRKDLNDQLLFTKYETVINIATIQSPLSNTFSIIGMSNFDEARRLSSLLRIGSLASPVFIEKECIIGPTLGKQNIIQGLTACGLGILISVCFMVFWYRYFGLIASIALILNLILMISMMSLIPSITLTMPSIAGIALALSVAIDANVLINERIKEEIKQGKPMQYAIYTGYRKAFTSIMDANVTTIITSIILYLVSTETIKGFAITIIIGIITSMFTSIIGTRALVNIIYGRKRVKKLSI